LTKKSNTQRNNPPLTRLEKIRILLDKAKRDRLVENIGGSWYTVIERDAAH
jgi:hypothetical protein